MQSFGVITDLPPGRIPVETYIFEGNYYGFEDVYKMMHDKLEAGGRVYLVYPVIEQSEQLPQLRSASTGGRVYLVYPVIEQSEQLPQIRSASTDLEVISHRFQGCNCGLLHGKMKSDDKEEALRRFRSGETHILLSIQVIEIGIDIPDASMMIVINAERFGTSQLHQHRV